MEIQAGNIDYGISLYLYLTALSTIGFLVMMWDKKQAKNQRRRISEYQLFLIAILGGSAGIAFSMLIFKHKTSKMKFYFGIPGIYVVQWTLLFGLLNYGF